MAERKRIVVCAACRYDDLILCGARHWDNVMRKQLNSLDGSMMVKHIEFEQGFIDQFGVFLTREKAMKVVKESGQPFDIDRNTGDTVLFSEGLY